MFECLTSDQLIKFRQTAVQVLVNCLIISRQPKKEEIFGILLNALENSNLGLQKTTYEHLKFVNFEVKANINGFVPVKMVSSDE